MGPAGPCPTLLSMRPSAMATRCLPCPKLEPLWRPQQTALRRMRLRSFETHVGNRVLRIAYRGRRNARAGVSISSFATGARRRRVVRHVRNRLSTLGPCATTVPARSDATSHATHSTPLVTDAYGLARLDPSAALRR